MDADQFNFEKIHKSFIFAGFFRLTVATLLCPQHGAGVPIWAN